MKKRMKRLYAPYVKEGKRWYRAGFAIPQEYPIGTGMTRKILYKALPKDQAIRRYQTWLLAPYLDGVDEIRALRPIPKDQATKPIDK